MSVHDLLWVMTKEDNFFIKIMEYRWLNKEPRLPSITSRYPVTMQEAIPYKELLGARIRNNWVTGAVASYSMARYGNSGELFSWYIDYPENKPQLIILLEMASTIHDVHGKSRYIANALTVIDSYEDN